MEYVIKSIIPYLEIVIIPPQKGYYCFQGFIVLTRYITEPTKNGHTIELVMLYYTKAFSCYTQVNSGLSCTITLTNVISILDAYNLQIPLFGFAESNNIVCFRL